MDEARRTEASPRETAPVLDRGTLDGLAALSGMGGMGGMGGPDGGSNFLRDCVDAYLLDIPARLEEVRAALAGGNADEMSRAAHTIKGSSLSLGALRMAQLCARLESLGRKGAVAEYRELMQDLPGEFARTEAGLKAYLAGPGSAP